MDRNIDLRHLHDPSVTALAIYTQPGIDIRALMTRILDRWPQGALNVEPNSSLKSGVLEIFDRTFRITYGLELVALLVAVLGIANTLVALTLERRMELAVLRFLGVSTCSDQETDHRRVRRSRISGLHAGSIAGSVTFDGSDPCHQSTVLRLDDFNSHRLGVFWREVLPWFFFPPSSPASTRP